MESGGLYTTESVGQMTQVNDFLTIEKICRK